LLTKKSLTLEANILRSLGYDIGIGINKGLNVTMPFGMRAEAAAGGFSLTWTIVANTPTFSADGLVLSSEGNSTNDTAYTDEQMQIATGTIVQAVFDLPTAATGCTFILGLDTTQDAGSAADEYALYKFWNTVLRQRFYENSVNLLQINGVPDSAVIRMEFNGTNMEYYVDDVLKVTGSNTNTANMYLNYLAGSGIEPADTVTITNLVGLL
jgi:hypothetical protein